MWFRRQQPARPEIVPMRDDIPAAIVLTFDPHAIDPETRRPRLGVLLEDAMTRTPVAARTLHGAADWLKSYGFRFSGVSRVWIRN